MAHWIPVGICAGLAAAVLQAAVLFPSPITMVLFYLSAVPMFVAALGWGVSAAALAGLSGGLAIAGFAGAKPALAFVVGIAVPPAVLSWLALRSRPADEAPPVEGEPQVHGLQWYPEGRLVLWAAALAAGLTSLVIVLLAPSADGLREMLSDLISQMFAATGDDTELSAEQLEQMVDVMALLLPVAAASVWLIAILVDMKLGARLLAAVNRSPRPWARFGALTFPRRAMWLLPLALLSTLLPGLLGLIGTVFAAAMFTAFALAGLAVLHGLTEGMTARSLLLAALYTALILLNWLLLVPLAVLTLLDMAFNMRARTAASLPTNRE